MTEASDAVAWFDQFTVWLAEHAEIKGSAAWCDRHWAPCPALRANGVGATIEMMSRWKATLPPNITAPAALNRQAERAGALCCVLGDEVMYSVWANWPPMPDVVVKEASDGES